MMRLGHGARHVVFPPCQRRLAQTFTTQRGRRIQASTLLGHLRDHALDPALAPSPEHISPWLKREPNKGGLA